MATSGWVYWDYNHYYPRSWGGMYKNAFITYDTNLYYLGSDSKMAIGWQSIDGNTYSFPKLGRHDNRKTGGWTEKRMCSMRTASWYRVRTI